VWLCFAPVKRARIDYIAEKATELGAALLQPVLTHHTVVERVNVERLRANAIEAAEQTERLSVPEVRAPLALPRLLADSPAGRGRGGGWWGGGRAGGARRSPRSCWRSMARRAPRRGRS